MGNLKWDHTELYVPFRWVTTESSVHFGKANTELSMHFRKANTEPSMPFRRDNTEILSYQILCKNLGLSDNPLIHLQTSSGKNFCQDTFGHPLFK